MNFSEATDSLCEKLDHKDVAEALGTSVQAVRQARLSPDATAYRRPRADWRHAIIRLAESRVWHYRRLIDALRKEIGGGQ